MKRVLSNFFIRIVRDIRISRVSRATNVTRLIRTTTRVITGGKGSYLAIVDYEGSYFFFIGSRTARLIMVIIMIGLLLYSAIVVNMV